MNDKCHKDVFISYSRKDTAIVLPVVERLRREGCDCWIDVDGIESSDEFKRVLVTAIRQSKIVLFFSSKNSNSTEWTVKEINIAVKLKKPIIPVHIDDTPYDDSILFDLSGVDYVMFTDDATRNVGMERLVRSVRSKTDVQSSRQMSKMSGLQKEVVVTRKNTQRIHPSKTDTGEITEVGVPSSRNLSGNVSSNNENHFSKVTYEMIRRAFKGGNDFYFCLLSNEATIEQKKIASAYRVIMNIPQEARIYAYWNDNTYIWQWTVKCGFVLGDMGIWIQSRDSSSPAFYSWTQMFGIQVVFDGLFSGGILRINTESKNDIFGWHEFKFSSFDEKNVAFLKNAFNRLEWN